jgi:hypothetical protein
MATKRVPLHVHDSLGVSETRPFGQCVAGRQTVCNPSAHDGVCHVHTCACGARRLENATDTASEFSGWGFGPV